MQQRIDNTNINGYPLIYKGKVRDIYQIDSDMLLIVATDRLSAFDVVLPSTIPNKGEILTKISSFWFKRTGSIVNNHCLDIDLREIVTSEQYEYLKNRAVLVQKANSLPIEAIIRGYIIGSGWKSYQKTGHICGLPLAKNLRLAERIKTPIYTPSTKAAIGDHDENISFEQTTALVGKDMAKEIKKISLKIYEKAYDYAKKQGLIIADTKLEFGVDKSGNLILIDELLTPDSSRYWSAADYQVGENPTSFDKQFIRDYLETLDWDKKSPGPDLPDEVIKKTYKKYIEVMDYLVIKDIADK